VLDKAKYSAFESMLNSSIVSYRIVSSLNLVELGLGRMVRTLIKNTKTQAPSTSGMKLTE